MKLLKATNVKRFHTVQTIGDQNLGHHSHRVCLILRYLLNGKVPFHLYEAALFHDLAESELGDLPAHTRWKDDYLNKWLLTKETEWNIAHSVDIAISTEERLVLDVADKLELIMYCTEQICMGNRNMLPIKERGVNYCMEQALPEDIFHRMKYLITEIEYESQ